MENGAKATSRNFGKDWDDSANIFVLKHCHVPIDYFVRIIPLDLNPNEKSSREKENIFAAGS